MALSLMGHFSTNFTHLGCAILTHSPLQFKLNQIKRDCAKTAIFRPFHGDFFLITFPFKHICGVVVMILPHAHNDHAYSCNCFKVATTFLVAFLISVITLPSGFEGWPDLGKVQVVAFTVPLLCYYLLYNYRLLC